MKLFIIVSSSFAIIRVINPGVSLIEEIGGYSILNRRVPLRFLWLALFNT